MSNIGFSASSKAINITNDVYQLPFNTPCWQSGRNWLLKLGLYKLNQPKPYTTDWIWIVDHSIQLGSEKVLVVLGIRENDIPSGRALRFEDMTVLGLKVSTNTNGNRVNQQLSELANLYGPPMHIVSDGGPDLKSGIEKYINTQPETKFIYDIKHKIATHLKRLLEKNESWLSFCQLAAQAQGYMRQTDVAALAPPNQRSKCRYMNLGGLLKWAHKIGLLDNDKIQPLLDIERKQRCLAWLEMYKDDIACWTRLLKITELTITHIAKFGIYRGLSKKLLFDFEGISFCPMSQQLSGLIIQDVNDNEYKVKPGYKTIGSSDIIESLFGCFKNLEKQQSSSGFTSLILAIPALVGKTTSSLVKRAMEGTQIKHIKSWVKENIGRSVQATRKICFNNKGINLV